MAVPRPALAATACVYLRATIDSPADRCERRGVCGARGARKKCRAPPSRAERRGHTFFAASPRLQVAPKSQQPRRLQASCSYAANAAPSGNPAKLVAAVVAVLGSGIVAALGTQTLITRGTRASRPAENGFSPSQTAINTQTLLNS